MPLTAKQPLSINYLITIMYDTEFRPIILSLKKKSKRSAMVQKWPEHVTAKTNKRDLLQTAVNLNLCHVMYGEVYTGWGQIHWGDVFYGSGYFSVKGTSPLEAILQWHMVIG